AIALLACMEYDSGRNDERVGAAQIKQGKGGLELGASLRLEVCSLKLFLELFLRAAPRFRGRQLVAGGFGDCGVGAGGELRGQRGEAVGGEIGGEFEALEFELGDVGVVGISAEVPIELLFPGCVPRAVAD